MDPVTLMAGASMLFSTAGAGVQMYGQYEQSQAQAQAANYQAQVARNNQIVAQQNAQLALEQGQVQEQAQRQKTGQQIGGIVAQEAASGVNPNSGSPLRVRSSAAETGELDALTIRSNSELQARNYLVNASSYGAQAGLLQAQAGWDASAGWLNMGTSLLGGAGSVSDKWIKYQQAGIFGGN